MRVWFLTAVTFVWGCGDNFETFCTPPRPELPSSGRFADPLTLPLPEDCVEGGLKDLPGRWFVVDPEQTFSFNYPLYKGTCETGFDRAFDQEDDLQGTAGGVFHTWSDGTRFYTRAHHDVERPGAARYEITSAFVACLLPDGTLAAVSAYYDTDRGDVMSLQIGTRFGLRDGPARGLSLVGEIAAIGPDIRISGFNVVVDGALAYVVGPHGLAVIDVSTPTAPVAIGHVASVFGFNDVRVVHASGKIVAFASSRSGDTAIIDVTNPAQPTYVQDIPEYSHSVHVTGTQLYLATYDDSVPVYDITNPLAPVRLGAALVPGEIGGVHDLFVDGTRLYINNTTAGFVALDVSAGLDSPVEVGHIPTSYSHASFVGTTTSGRKVILHGDEGMTGTPDLGAFLRIIDGDHASPTYMQELGRYQSRPEVGIHNIDLVGDRVYLSYYQDGIRVVDIADPALPREVAHFNTWDPLTSAGASFEGAFGVRVVGGLIYVADDLRGLLILRED